MADNLYISGATARLNGSFTDLLGNPVDPTVIQLKVQHPTGAVSTYTYGVSGSPIVRDSTGVYHANQLLSERGTWDYKWLGNDTVNVVTSAAENQLLVVSDIPAPGG